MINVLASCKKFLGDIAHLLFKITVIWEEHAQCIALIIEFIYQTRMLRELISEKLAGKLAKKRFFAGSDIESCSKNATLGQRFPLLSNLFI